MNSGSEIPEPPKAVRTLLNRTAVVTGGSRGIGLAICRALAREGAQVAPIGRTAKDLETAAAEIRSAGGTAPEDPIVADVTRAADMEAAARRLESRWGSPDVLVLCAGRADFRSIAEMSFEEWDREIAVNLSGVFYTVRCFLPGMIQKGRGDIVTLGSVASIKSFTGCGAYGAAKFGLRGFTGVLREELRGNGIRVTSILAGATETGIWGKELPAAAERLMRPEAVAEAVIAAVTADSRTVIEEILLRPVLGDL